ncbi:MAG: hypothetical protein VX473_04630 [Candidatus Thermoplasmatota archaeon]|nr:hypothetical protein [Candidatus Thermoplasmatota archaeon]
MIPLIMEKNTILGTFSDVQKTRFGPLDLLYIYTIKFSHEGWRLKTQYD